MLSFRQPHQDSVITLNDFLYYWQGLLDGNHSDPKGRFWYLLKKPGHTYVEPEDLRPLVEALVAMHDDLAFLRTDAEQRDVRAWGAAAPCPFADRR